ncbi:MAG TPA: Mur ligase family protein [Candidatus Saccharimonadales bacterium]
MQLITSLGAAEAALVPYWPSNLGRHAYTLEYIEQFMETIGNPQNQVKVIHVAGTSGKTSTAYYIASLLQRAGKRVGLMISPHIEQINERVQVNLTPLPEQEFCSELTIFLDLMRQSGITLTYAEILYGFAYWEFVRQRVDYVVAETGMGGLLDATNVASREDKICVITDIGLDHVHVLGNTLPDIAGHKAGIIHLHNAVFCHSQDSGVVAVIKQQTAHKQGDLHVVEQGDAPAFLPHYQRRNFSLAREVVNFALARAGDLPLLAADIKAAARVHIPGRMELFTRQSKQVVLDNAHNVQKLHGLVLSLQEQFPGQRPALLLAFAETPGRNIDDMLAELVPIASHVIITDLPPGTKHHTGRNTDELVAACQKAGISCEIIADQEAAYKALLRRSEPVAVVTGSTYLLSYLRPIVVHGV